MKLEKELEKGNNYKEGHQGKWMRYNASAPEIAMNMSNNKQEVTMTKVPPNYSQVLQAPTPTDVQMDVDQDGNRAGQPPPLPKPQLPRAATAGMVTILHEANWMPTKEIRPTVGL